MAKMMTQLYVFAKNVMGAGSRSVNVVFVGNHRGGYRANYPRTGGDQGLNRDEGWRDRDGQWCDRNATWKEKKGRMIGMFLPTRVKTPKILRVARLGIGFPYSN